MRIGYLHLGAPSHGVRRYGALLAAEARRQAGLQVIEAESVLTGERRRDHAALVETAHGLSAADVVHLQYSPKIWGGRPDQLRNLRTFVRHCEAPLVATLHDVYSPRAASVRWPRALSALQGRIPGLRRQRQRAEASPDRRIAAAVERAAAGTMGPSSYAAVRWLLDNVQAALVSSDEESRQLNEIGRASVGIVRHFIEERILDLEPVEARAALEMENRVTLTLLGFIHPRKGHHLVVEALAELDADVQVVFAGGATTNGPGYLHDVLALAEVRGLRDRVHVTGYVPEDVLDRYLAATDLAVCPFLACAASGSLSTWISVGRPVIASDLPQIAEYNVLEPGAIDIFRPSTGAGLANAIRRRLAGGTRPQNVAASRVARRLGISRMVDEHLRWYRRAATLGANVFDSRSERNQPLEMKDSDTSVSRIGRTSRAT